MEEGRYRHPSLATRELNDHAMGDHMNYYRVKLLLEDKADPTWRGNPSAVCRAVYSNQVDILRLMYAMCPNIDDPPMPGYYSMVELAIDERKAPALETLLELGLAYKHLRGEFESCNRRRGGHGRWRKIHNDERAKIAAIYTRFMAREDGARAAACAFMSSPMRTRLGRDLARMIGERMWATRRAPEWEPREALANRWHTMKLRQRK